MAERQTIVTWYEPDEKLPPEGSFVLVTMSGKAGRCNYIRTLKIAAWYNDGTGWEIEGWENKKDAEFTIHAWADIDPYGLKGGLSDEYRQSIGNMAEHKH